MTTIEAPLALFLVNHGCSGHAFVELGSIIEAPDLLSAKRMALDLGPDWTTDLYVERVSADDANEHKSIIEDAKAEARDNGSEC